MEVGEARSDVGLYVVTGAAVVGVVRRVRSGVPTGWLPHARLSHRRRRRLPGGRPSALRGEFDIHNIDILADGSARANAYDSCQWCSHDWHGLPCNYTACGCESTTTCREDSWRPRLLGTLANRARWVMHETGCDGWTASIAAGDYSTFTTASLFRGSRLMAELYGNAPRAA